MLGKRLTAARRARGLTQEQLAAEVGVTTSTISMYEKGTRTPNAMLLGDMCRVLRVSADALLGLLEPPPGPASREDFVELLGRLDSLTDEAREYIARLYDVWDVYCMEARKKKKKGRG